MKVRDHAGIVRKGGMLAALAPVPAAFALASRTDAARIKIACIGNRITVGAGMEKELIPSIAETAMSLFIDYFFRKGPGAAGKNPPPSLSLFLSNQTGLEGGSGGYRWD